jgi:hypothetical protein
MTITIESQDTNLINSILYLLKGNKNTKVEISATDEQEASESLDFHKFDLETQRIIQFSIEDYRNGKKDRFVSFEQVFPAVIQA